MNIDLFASAEFKDEQAIRAFILAHEFVHLETANALTAKYGVTVSTFGLESPFAEEEWIKSMNSDPGSGTPAALRDWLNFHAYMHTQTYSLLGQNPTVAPDLSVVDFSSEEQFYDWMYVHMEMHDFEYSSLGLT